MPLVNLQDAKKRNLKFQQLRKNKAEQNRRHNNTTTRNTIHFPPKYTNLGYYTFTEEEKVLLELS